MKKLEVIKEELELSNSSNLDLIEKIEFKEIQPLLFKTEEVIELQIGAIDEIAHLLVVTSQRLFIVKKKMDIISKVQQFGLEEIKDIKLNEYAKTFSLVFYINNEIIKVDYLTQQQSKTFGKKCVDAIEKWNKFIELNLV